MSKDRLREITHEVMSDKTVVPLLVIPNIAWCLAQSLRVASRYPGRPDWGKKSHIALAKKLEKAVKERHPLPDIYKMEDLYPIITDQEVLLINVSMREAFEIVGGVQLTVTNPDLSEYLRDLTTVAAQSIQERIIEHHPDAAMMIHMGWNS